MAALRPGETAPDEYLEKTGVTALLKEVMLLLLENRPLRPVDFIAEW
jgi:hypothetical protein